jgi:holo-ACP synthase/triphosphoribosyl-dephospho-CoA synthase
MNIEKIMGSRRITLSQMLDARERRANRQREMLRSGAECLVSCTLNMPGEIKQFPLAQAFFAQGLARLEKTLSCIGADIKSERRFLDDDTGSEAFLAVQCDPVRVKMATCALEESSPASRLYDLDVLDAQGQKISRTQLGLPERKCIICGRPVMECAPRRIHTAEELSHAAVRLMYDDLTAAFAGKIAEAAQKALLYEVCVSPKPGLVDRFNNGSHQDMNLYSFVDSACALYPYFRQCVLIGAENALLEPSHLFQLLRVPGMEAEQVMYEATGGVNVHKGAIFSMGTLCAARGQLWNRGETAVPEKLMMTVQSMLKWVCDDFKRPARTAGEKIYQRSGVKGIRGEAASGFPAVTKLGLPLLERLLGEGISVNDAAAVVLLHLICAVEDTNMIKRSSVERFREVQREISVLLQEVPVPPPERIAALDRQFIAENLSPGGCADMLALTLLLHFLRPFENEISPAAESVSD